LEEVWQMSAECATDRADAALSALLRSLKKRNYHFVTPTPATHSRVIARPDRRRVRELVDVLGWSLPFASGQIEPEIEDLLRAADMIEEANGLLKSRLRVSSLGGRLYLHSAFPTLSKDAVFFGPDSYRFADLIAAEFDRCPPRRRARIVDIGAGAGVGAIVAAQVCPEASVTMTDINPKALRLARINAAAAGVVARTFLGAGLAGVEGSIDIALANPPYIVDDAGRTYRDGGGLHGGAVALEMARSALDRLAPGGRLILYTGSAIIEGADPLCEALGQLANEAGFTMRCREIDPDVFGEELDRPPYLDVDRIAIVAAIISAES
jgi:methylase of polypeptide subunit release factors